MASKYTLIGAGRVAKHFSHYLNLLNISFNQWSRHSNTDLDLLVQDSSHVLLLISDGAIENFIKTNDFLYDKKLVHFSGALNIENVLAAHPLASFSHDLFSLDFYKKIPFCVDAEGPEFSEILPGLPNPCFRIPSADKALYHALCVMSGNFTAILWQKFFAELEKKWNIPHEVAFLYLQSVTQNLQTNSHVALTGPLARGDQLTIEKNLAALGDDAFAKIYKVFVEMYGK